MNKILIVVLLFFCLFLLYNIVFKEEIPSSPSLSPEFSFAPTPTPTIEPTPQQIAKENPPNFIWSLDEPDEITHIERPWVYNDTLTPEENIYDYLSKETPLSRAAICGILGNMAYETGWTFDPEASNGFSYGLCQWLGVRLSSLKDFCDKNDKDFTTIQGQLDFLIWELQNEDPYGTWDYLLKVEDNVEGARLAGRYFCIWFERPLYTQAQAKYRGYEATLYYEKFEEVE